jgi:hypothetical protein
MSNQYVVLLKVPKAPAEFNETVEKVLDGLVNDWLRTTQFQYLVVTPKSMREVSDGIRTVLRTEDSILVLKVDLGERSGWVAPLVIDWLKKYD